MGKKHTILDIILIIFQIPYLIIVSLFSKIISLSENIPLDSYESSGIGWLFLFLIWSIMAYFFIPIIISFISILIGTIQMIKSFKLFNENLSTFSTIRLILSIIFLYIPIIIFNFIIIISIFLIILVFNKV